MMRSDADVAASAHGGSRLGDHGVRSRARSPERLAAHLEEILKRRVQLHVVDHLEAEQHVRRGDRLPSENAPRAAGARSR